MDVFRSSLHTMYFHQRVQPDHNYQVRVIDYTSYFHTFIPFRDITWMLAINKGSGINVVSTQFVKRMRFKTVLHLEVQNPFG